MNDLPDVAKRALEDGEVVKWVGKPARLPKLQIWFFRFFYGVAAIIALAAIVDIGVPLLMGEVPIMEGEPVTFRRAWPPTLLSIFVLGGFWFLFKWNFGKYRYVVTDRRAFHYRPIWGGSWKWNPSDGFRRNYDDPETSPISGGYFTAETTTSRHGSDDYGVIEIGPLSSTMEDAHKIRQIKRVMPFLDNIIYDPANLDFHEVENPAAVEKTISAVLKEFKNEQAH